MKTIFTLLALCVLSQINAQQNIVSIKCGNWNDPTTWNTTSVPSASDNVFITGGYSITFNSLVNCNDLQIATGNSLVAIDASSLVINGNFCNSGIFQPGSGSFIFNGNSPQIISGNATSVFYNLAIDNLTGLTLAANVNIKYLLSIHQGTLFTANNKLTLLSDSVMTASIDSLINGADVSGEISVQRYISSSVTGWRFLGSPVRTTLADWGNDFVTSGFPGSSYPNFNFCSIYSYDETAAGTSVYGYEIPLSINDSIKKGAGYWCWIGPTPGLLEVSGIPNKGNHTFSVSLTPDSGKNEDGWNMVSNPYPSSVDWDSQAWTKTGIQNAIYIWDPTQDQYSTYIDGVSINGGSNIISSSQAFWVQANQNSPVLSCSESVKIHNNQTYLKSAKTTNNILKLAVNGNGYKDETVIRLVGGASQSVSPSEDAIKLYSDNMLVPGISSIADSLQMVVNTLPLSISSHTVSIRVVVGVSGTYTLTKDENFTFGKEYCVFLEDLTTGAKINVRSPFSYVFNINSADNSPRFILHINKPMTTSLSQPACSYLNTGKAVATVNGEWDLNWKDAQGNILRTAGSISNCDSILNLIPGNYFVSAQRRNSSCSFVESKFVIVSATPILSSVSVSNNICTASNNGFITISNVNGGSGPYNYSWSNAESGEEIKNLESGSYTLTITDNNGCSDTSVYKVKTLSTLNSAFTLAGDSMQLMAGKEILFLNQTTDFNSCVWSFDGQEYTTDINAGHIFTTTGMHTIELNVSDRNCMSTSKMVVDIKPSKNAESDEEVLVMSLDDQSASVKFDLQQAQKATVFVFTVDGKLIHSSDSIAFKNTETVPLGSAHGIYIVTVKTQTNSYQYKIIK